MCDSPVVPPAKASFEVYLGDANPNNLILAQGGNYGDKNNISRSFVLFKKQKDSPPDSSDLSGPVRSDDVANVATPSFDGGTIHVMCLVLMVSLVNFMS